MLQRIQSFYLVLAATAMALCFMFPIAKYQAANPIQGAQEYVAQLKVIPQQVAAAENPGEAGEECMLGGDVSEYGYKKVTMWPMMMWAIVLIVLSLTSIFLYKNRTLQVRFVAVGFLLNVAYVFLTFFWVVDAFQKGLRIYAQNWHASYSIGTWAPIVSVVFLFLAQNAIKRDEKKVRDADRLR